MIVYSHFLVFLAVAVSLTGLFAVLSDLGGAAQDMVLFFLDITLYLSFAFLCLSAPYLCLYG